MTAPFLRGSMTFEDYNYDLYNEHILIDPDLEESDEELKEKGKFHPVKKVNQQIKEESNKNKVRLIAPNLRGFEEPHYQELLNVRSKEDFYYDQQMREEQRKQQELEN